MSGILELAAANLISPIILSFVLGLFAAFARSDLSIPEAIAKGMSIYLLFAIGFKGGASVAGHGVDGTLLAAIGAGLVSEGGPTVGRPSLIHCAVSGRRRLGTGHAHG